MGLKFPKRTVVVILAALIVAAMVSTSMAATVTINSAASASLTAGPNAFDLGSGGLSFDQSGNVTVNVAPTANTGSISGSVDSAGILVYAYLQPSRASNGAALFQTIAVGGGFAFSEVPYGEYTLLLVCPGHPEVQFTPDPTSNPVVLNSTTQSVSNLNFTADVSTSCTYTYSSWGACQQDGTQTRTVLSSSPSGCAGTPVTSQSCTYDPGVTACTSWSYSSWGACQSNNTQTRTVTASYPSGCVGSPAPSQLTRACTYTPPPTTGSTNLGASGSWLSGSVAANGENHYYFKLTNNATMYVSASMLSADWKTNQDLIVGLTQPKCSDMVGTSAHGENGFWYGPGPTSNEVVSIAKSFSAGTTLYVTVCNRSSVTGYYKLEWSYY